MPDGRPIGVEAESAPGAAKEREGLVSVILPVFNACSIGPHFLRAAVASVCSQSYRHLELVIVDDGSTDGSVALCEEEIARHREVPIRLYRKANGGQSSARNAGAAVSRGEYLSFIDQDDVWYRRKLEVSLQAMRPGVEVVYTDADTIDEEGHVELVGIHGRYGCGNPHPKRKVEDILFRDVYVMPGLMTVRRATFQEVGGFDEALSGYEDDDLFLRLFERATIAYLPKSTMCWRQYAHSASRSLRMVESRVAYWRKLMAGYTDGGGNRVRARGISRRFVREMLHQANCSFQEGGAVHQENIATARELMSHVGPWQRLIFAAFLTCGLRWRSPSPLLERFWERWLHLA